MKNEILNKIIVELEKKGPILLSNHEKVENYKFLKKGHIDSINLIQFLIVLEKRFDISFTGKDTSSKEFGSVKGLAQIIKKKLKNKQIP